jgi:hypothetical protein
MGIVTPAAVLQANDQALSDQPASSSVNSRVIIFSLLCSPGSGVGIGDVNHRLNSSLRRTAVDRQRSDL